MNSPPQYLYKYRPVDIYTESWFVKDELYFAPTAKFNDPFDCKANLSLDATDDELFSFLRQRAAIKQLPKKQRSRATRLIIKSGVYTSPDASQAHIDTVQGTIDSYGVLSLTQKNDDILMFSHYGDCHRGYCLEFNCEKGSYLGTAEQVRYRDEYPLVNYYTMAALDLMRAATLTKSMQWSYEMEWRAFQKPAGLRRPKQSPLSGIILGCQMPLKDKEFIRSLNQRRTKPVRLYQAQRKHNKFGLDIVSLD